MSTHVNKTVRKFVVCLLGGVLICGFGGGFLENNLQQESYLTAKKEVQSFSGAVQTKCRSAGSFKLTA